MCVCVCRGVTSVGDPEDPCEAIADMECGLLRQSVNRQSTTSKERKDLRCQRIESRDLKHISGMARVRLGAPQKKKQQQQKQLKKLIFESSTGPLNPTQPRPNTTAQTPPPKPPRPTQPKRPNPTAQTSPNPAQTRPTPPPPNGIPPPNPPPKFDPQTAPNTLAPPTSFPA